MKPLPKDAEDLLKARRRIGKKLGKKHGELWLALTDRQQLHWASQHLRGISLLEVCEAILNRYNPDGSDKNAA